MATQTPSDASVTGGQMVAYGVAGLVVVVLAQYAPRLVNSILILILVGLLLNHASAFTSLVNTLPGMSPAK